MGLEKDKFFERHDRARGGHTGPKSAKSTGFDTVGGVIVEDFSGPFLDLLEKGTRTAMNRIGTIAVNQARDDVPIGKTRRMHDGIAKTISTTPTTITLRVGGRDQKTHLFIFGTVKMVKNDFLTDATKNMGEDLSEEVGKVLAKLSQASAQQ